MKSIGIIGGGLAGLAAAVAAAERGLRVELFEARRRLGGRAGSFRDPETGELVDHCQHVSMGCCTALADFCRRTGIADCFARHSRLHFIGPDGSQHDFAASRWLPAPLHLIPGLLGLKYLPRGERFRTAWAMARLARERPTRAGTEAEQTVLDWLRRHRQSDLAIQQFWSVVLVSALSESLDRASLAAARKVFVEGFMASRNAYELEIPRVPLGEIYDRRVAAWLADHRVRVHLGARVRRVEGDAGRATSILLADGSRREFDSYIAAVPWRTVRDLFPESMLATMGGLAGVGQLEPAPITAVHLWFDRPITPLPHAILVGRLSQWVFNKSLLVRDRADDEPGRTPNTFLYQVVISASHELRGRDRREVVDQVLAELHAVWPDARREHLVRWRMLTEPEAVFSPQPGADRFRPSQATPIGNLALAGDWTATGWPATMESAVRSGNMALDALLRTKPEA